ncbi:50S ribosomal protein L18e [Candidatus Woesearchaeota archaeon]|nr:50S ribosomal protein L18e [Candidatus Woesearchaeota archaeon]
MRFIKNISSHSQKEDKMRNVQKNQSLMELVQLLKKTALENDAAVWKRVALDLEKPTKQRRIVNLYKIEKTSKDGELVVVPGKVLGTGDLSRKVSVAAYAFSEDALRKIKAQKGDVLTIREAVTKNPKGQQVRIMG